MKNKDKVISEGVEKINEKIENLKAYSIESIKPYRVKTNCRCFDKNIRTCSIPELIELFKLVLAEKTAYENAVALIGANDIETEDGWEIDAYVAKHGHNPQDMIDDILYCIRCKQFDEKLYDLVAKRNALERYHSNEHKEEKAINDILASI